MPLDRSKFRQFAGRGSYDVGGFVTWNIQGKEFSGKIAQTFTSGTITPAGRSVSLRATEQAPVIEVELYEKTGDLWQPTGQKVTRPALACQNIADLRRPASYTGLTVVNKKDDQPDEIIIYSDIGSYDFWTGESGATAKDIREQLKKIPSGKAIDMRINSPGGDAFEGMAIYNILSQHSKQSGSKITGYNDGLCASAATVIMMAADKIIAGETSLFMIHRAFSIAFGTGNDMRTQAELLDRIDGQTIDLYYGRVKDGPAKLSRDKVEGMVDAETYMDANEQVENGFADEVYQTKGKARAYGPLRPWLHKPPVDLRKQFSAPVENPASRVPDSGQGRAEAA
jgi:ATP-dependent protease ClpP protease subunit